MVTYTYPVGPVPVEHIALPIIDQETMEIPFTIVSPPRNTLEIYIKDSVDNPQLLSSHRPFVCSVAKRMLPSYGVKIGNILSTQRLPTTLVALHMERQILVVTQIQTPYIDAQYVDISCNKTVLSRKIQMTLSVMMFVLMTVARMARTPNRFNVRSI